MSSVDDQPPGDRWSPFPVQDWTRMPADPLAAAAATAVGPAGGDRSAVDPRWPAPRRPRRWWLPLAVLTAIGVLLAGTSYAGMSRGPDRPDAASRFLPADGSVGYARVETTRELATTVTTEVTESARLTGITGLLSTDQTFGTRAMAPLFDQSSTLRIWRTISTPVDARPTAPQTTRLYRVGAGVQLLGESTPTEGYAYAPGLVELPADVAAGRTWSSAGSAGDVLDYRSEFRSTGAADGCLDVTGEVSYLTKQGSRVRMVGVSRTWCPGQGLVASSQSLAPVRTARARIVPPPPQPVTTTDQPVAWPAPQTWAARTLDTVSVNPVFGQGPMNGSTSTAVTPVRTRSGLVVRALSAPADLVATTPRTPQVWASVWRAHPGGNILTLAAFGNVVVVTTSARQVLGYSDTGVRLWQLDLDELAPTAPVRVSDTEVALVDLSGDVRQLDLVTGVVGWHRNVGSDVSVAPAAGSGVVVVADRSYTVTALDAGTGQVRWTTPLDVKGLAVVGDLVVAVQDQTAHALALDSGRHRWLRHYDGTFTRVVAYGTGVLLTAKSASLLLDHEGAVRTRLAGYLDVTTTPGAVVGWGAEEAELVDPGGRVLSRWDIPDVSVVSALRPGLALPEGVLLFNLDWTFGAWTGG